VCGIAGCIDPFAREEVLGRAIQAMIAPLHHRGPDDEGVWLDQSAGVALGHKRLSILDLSPAGHQPMISPGGRYVVVFNGEIYNHLELRKELDPSRQKAVGPDEQRRGWRGHSDTETLLAGFDVWGVEKTVRRTVGMFAFAVWDKASKILTLARDRLGEKPLYYGWQGNAFLFGSELKALRCHSEFRGEVNRDALTLLLRHNYIPAPYSIYSDIHKLLPGTCLQVNPRERNAQPVPYWSAREHAEQGRREQYIGSEERAVTDLEELIKQSLAGQMVADVPLGAFLSGGVDSSTVVALMQQLSRRPVRTFTIGFHEDAYNEAEHARAVARHLGTDHTELYVTPEETLAVIPRLPELYDEPFADSSQIPTFLVSKLARQHVTVSLSGDGGDELFGGYNRYHWATNIWRKLGWLPRPLRSALAGLLTTLPPTAWDTAFDRLRCLVPPGLRYSDAGLKLHKLAEVLAVRTPEEIYWGLVSHWKHPADLVPGAKEPPTVLTDTQAWADVGDFEHRMMYFDTVSYLPDDILVKVDRAAMGVSLETRVPFLDHRLVEFAWRLPLQFKVRGGVTKWLLRQVLYRHVPRNLIERPKMGFGVPIDSWLRDPLKKWAESLLDPARLLREGFFNPTPIQQKWKEHLSGRRNWQYYLWDVLMFQAWLENENSR
jgi:asparagine synthase (glutamine-hydrolysing)